MEKTSNTIGCGSLEQGFKGGLCHSFDKYVLSTKIQGSGLGAMGNIREQNTVLAYSIRRMSVSHLDEHHLYLSMSPALPALYPFIFVFSSWLNDNSIT